MSAHFPWLKAGWYVKGAEVTLPTKDCDFEFLVMRFLLIHPWKGEVVKGLFSIHAMVEKYEQCSWYYDTIILWFSMIWKNSLNIVHGIMNATFIHESYEHRSCTIIVHSYIYEKWSLWTMIMAWGYEHRSLWSMIIGKTYERRS